MALLERAAPATDADLEIGDPGESSSCEGISGAGSSSHNSAGWKPAVREPLQLHSMSEDAHATTQAQDGHATLTDSIDQKIDLCSPRTYTFCFWLGP